jgi:hypothetical protein
MKAVCWCGSEKIHVQRVPDPRLLDPRDIIVRITLTTMQSTFRKLSST